MDDNSKIVEEKKKNLVKEKNEEFFIIDDNSKIIGEKNKEFYKEKIEFCEIQKKKMVDSMLSLLYPPDDERVDDDLDPIYNVGMKELKRIDELCSYFRSFCQ